MDGEAKPCGSRGELHAQGALTVSYVSHRRQAQLRRRASVSAAEGATALPRVSAQAMLHARWLQE